MKLLRSGLSSPRSLVMSSVAAAAACGHVDVLAVTCRGVEGRCATATGRGDTACRACARGGLRAADSVAGEGAPPPREFEPWMSCSFCSASECAPCSDSGPGWWLCDADGCGKTSCAACDEVGTCSSHSNARSSCRSGHDVLIARCVWCSQDVCSTQCASSFHKCSTPGCSRGWDGCPDEYGHPHSPVVRCEDSPLLLCSAAGCDETSCDTCNIVTNCASKSDHSYVLDKCYVTEGDRAVRASAPSAARAFARTARRARARTSVTTATRRSSST